MKGIGDRVRQLRISRGWSQQELGKRARGLKETPINKETINRIEHGCNTTTETLRNIADAFGVRIGDILPVDQYPTDAAIQDDNLSVKGDPAHARYHDLLERILQDHEPRCINTVIAVLETIAGGSAPETSGNEKSQGRSNPGQAETAGRGNPGHRELMAVAEKINPYDTSGADRKRNDIPEPSIGVPNGRSRSKSGWRG